MALDFNIKMEYMDSEMMPDAHNFSLEETANALQTVYVCRSANQLDKLLFSPLLGNYIKTEPTLDFNIGQEHYIVKMEQVNDYSHEEFQEPNDLEMTPDQLEAAFNIQPPLHTRNFNKQTKKKTSWQKNGTRQRKVNSSKKSRKILHKPNKSVIKKAQPKTGTCQRKVNSKTDSRDRNSKNIYPKQTKLVVKKQNKMFDKKIQKKHFPKNGTWERKVNSSKIDSRDGNSKNIHRKPNKSVVKKTQQNKTCGKTINKKHVPKIAQEMALTSKKHQCELCNVIFPQKKFLVKHKKLHKKINKTFPCRVCKESFSDIISLLKHSQIHSNEKNCKVYSESFTGNETATLRAHKKTHMGEKPFKCDVCSKSFFNVTGLKSHGKSHLSRQLFECDVCRKSFRNHMNLSFHTATHKNKDTNLESDPPKEASIDDKAHVIVDRALSSSTILKPMIVTTPKNSTVCVICNRSFKSCQNLKFHMRSHKNHRLKSTSIEDNSDTPSKKTNVCDNCSRAFQSYQVLKIHMRSHKIIDNRQKSRMLNPISFHFIDKNLETGRTKQASIEEKAHGIVVGAPTSTKMLKPKIKPSPSKKSLETDPRKEASIDDKAHVIVDKALSSSTLLKKMIKTTPKNSTLCVICNRSFKNCQTLKIHTRSHKNDRQKPASIEDRPDDKSTVVILKPQTGCKTHSKTSFKCDVCNKSLKTKMALRFHSKTHKTLNKNIENDDVHKASEINKMRNVPNNFECHICEKSFKNKLALKSLSKTHKILSKLLERDPLNADTNADNSDDHEVVAVDTQDEEDTCANFGDTDGDADKKSATPSKETNVCDICSRSYESYQVLKLHMRSHKIMDKNLESDSPKQASIDEKEDDIVDEEPASSKIQKPKIKPSPSKKSFDFGICSKSFKSSQKLKIQTMSHKIINKNWETEQPPHLDSIEDKADDKSTIVILKPQTGRKTPSKTPFKCDVCNKSFKTKMALTFHSKSHKIFNKNIENDIVDRATTSSHKMLKAVIETTPKNSIVCGVCSRSFKTCQVLNFHMRSHKNHSQKPASIEDKPDDKSTVVILKPHTSRKIPSKTPFKCEVCAKSLKTKMALRFHSKTHKILNKTLEHEPLKAAGKETISS